MPQRQYCCNLYNRASTLTQTFHSALFSVRNVRNPSSAIRLLKKKKKKRASFLKEQRGIFAAGSDGQGDFPLMLFVPSVFNHEGRQCEKLGCCSNGATSVGSPSIWLIIRTLCAAQTKKDTELIVEGKRESVKLNQNQSHKSSKGA